MLLVASGRHPDGSRVELTPAEADTLTGVVAIADSRDDSVHTLSVLPAAAAKAPPVWFAEVRESSARPPAVNLIAFAATGATAAGRLVAEVDVPTEVESADQVGAVRWYPATGEVDQIYVRPDARRRSVGTVLVLAAGVLARARDWPRLWGDGQRTELGEAWRNRSVWRDRTHDLTHTAPPMTPDGDG